MNAEIEDLEYFRSSRSMSLNDEKATIKQIVGVKQKMAQYVELHNCEEELNALRESIDAAYSRRAELREGISTLKQVARVRELNPGEVVELTNVLSDDVSVPVAIIPRLVGRGGETRVQLETELGVLLDFKDRKREGEDAAAPAATHAIVKVTGLAAGLAKARAKFDEIASEEEETVDVDAGLINFLLSRSAAGIKQLETDAGVRAKALRDVGKVRVVFVVGTVSHTCIHAPALPLLWHALFLLAWVLQLPRSHPLCCGSSCSCLHVVNCPFTAGEADWRAACHR